MDRVLKPDRLDLNPNSTNDVTASTTFTHWKATFDNFLATLGEPAASEQQKYTVLINYVSPELYQTISSINTYAAAIEILKSLFVKQKNETFSRYCLLNRNQKDGESIDSFMIALEALAQDCNFEEVTALLHRQQSVRTAFISGIKSPQIRQRLLEETKSLDDTYKAALTLERASSNSEQYQRYNTPQLFSSALQVQLENPVDNPDAVLAATNHNQQANWSQRKGGKACYFCGCDKHYRQSCPARESTCDICGKRGHWAKVCRSGKRTNSTSNTAQNSYRGTNSANRSVNSNLYNSDPHNSDLAMPGNSYNYLAAISSSSPRSLDRTIVRAKVNNFDSHILIDSGSSDSFVDKGFTIKHGLFVEPCTNSIINMASELHSSSTLGTCSVDINVMGHILNNVRLMVLDKLCTDVILGLNILSQHEKLEVHFGGSKPPLLINESPAVCTLSAAKIDPPPLFANLSDNAYPIACRSRKYSQLDTEFIQNEVARLLSENIIEPSNSSWRAQVLVTGQDKPKPRLVIDYSKTVNKFTLLDAYPLPNMDILANKIAQYSLYSTFDLRSAYHQIPIRDCDKPYTAFEANGRLYHFNRVPFGVTNGGAAFQRIMDKLIDDNSLTGTFAYLDNLTVCGCDQADHDANVSHFLDMIKSHGLTLNEDKTISSVETINILGFLISKGTIRPDPERMQPLRDLPVPHDPASLKRALGLFSYYSQWISKFSDKIGSLTNDPTFPLSTTAVQAFNDNPPDTWYYQ
jgi:hypothetical protein